MILQNYYRYVRAILPTGMVLRSNEMLIVDGFYVSEAVLTLG